MVVFGCAHGLGALRWCLDNFAHLRPIAGELVDSFQDWIFAFLCLKAGKPGLAPSPELVWRVLAAGQRR